MSTTASPNDRSLRRAFLLVLIAYLVALAVAWAVAWVLRGHHPLAIVAWADLAATLVIFVFSLAFDNSSFYDIYWSVAPVPIVLYLAFHPDAGGDPIRRALLVLLVTAWGVRLTWNWIRTWQGLQHEDWRYIDLRHKTGAAYWLVSFTGLHLFPTLIVLLACVPLYPASTLRLTSFNALDLLATLVTGGAIALEALADQTLYEFRRQSPPAGAILDRGPWRWSRHPNYLGEMGFWWGLALFGLAARAPVLTTIAGAASITAMFVFITIPMIERRMLARRPAYAERIRRVSMVVPWPPKP
ncbi:MAG TPA: DUF1295 domain-containing protein [Polyangia bacterium]|jgi:steroid 5-alpha reductase family enzyme|nr:DUF1295 domain-containing protein [Polyangia bacterium]